MDHIHAELSMTNEDSNIGIEIWRKWVLCFWKEEVLCLGRSCLFAYWIPLCPDHHQVRPDQRPSILKSSVKAKSPDLKSSSCTNHHEEQAAHTAMQAFGAAAAGLARDLNVLMKDRRSRQDLQGQAQNKRKVVWASPEACELGPPLTCKSWSSQSATQPGHPKHHISSKQPPTHSNALLGDATPSAAAQGVHAARKTKDQQKGPCMKQSIGFNYAQPPQKRSLPKNSDIYDEAVACGGKQGPQGTGIKSKIPLSVQERARTEATKVLDCSASEIFDYNQFRQVGVCLSNKSVHALIRSQE